MVRKRFHQVRTIGVVIDADTQVTVGSSADGTATFVYATGAGDRPDRGPVARLVALLASCRSAGVSRGLRRERQVW